jgi:hypothetical protein
MNVLMYLGAERGGLGGSCIPLLASSLLSAVAVALAAAVIAARAAAVCTGATQTS